MAKDERSRLVKADEFVQGGLLNDADVEVVKSRIAMFDYQGSRPEVCSLELTLLDNNGDEHVQNWTMGGEGEFGPSSDGKFVMALGDKRSLNKGSNYDILVESLMRCGMPKGIITEDVSILEGTKGHVLRVPAPTRNIEGSKKREDGRVPTILTFSDVKSFPWDKKGSKASKAAAKAKTKVKDDDDDDGGSDAGESESLEDIAKRLVKSVLEEAGEAIETSDLGMAVFKAATKDGVDKADRTKVMNMAVDADFLGAIEGVEVNGDEVSLA